MNVAVNNTIHDTPIAHHSNGFFFCDLSLFTKTAINYIKVSLCNINVIVPFLVKPKSKIRSESTCLIFFDSNFACEKIPVV